MACKTFPTALATLMAMLLLVAGQVGAHAEKRVALVIGNSGYAHGARLKTPANDAEAMAAKLAGLSFSVIKGIDLDAKGMRTAIAEFKRSISDAQVALLYFSGLGLQVDKVNYLLPVDAKLKSEIDLQFQAVPVDSLLQAMESRNRTSILLLDACRDNPLTARFARSMNKVRGRTVLPGLARIDGGVDTYVGFSTSPNSLAPENGSKNSTFTHALLKYVGAKGEDIETIMGHVREDVIKATDGSQIPWGNSSPAGRFVLNEGQFATATEEVVQKDVGSEKSSGTDISTLIENLKVEDSQKRSGSEKQIETKFWNSIKDSSDPDYFRAYLEQYPQGVFAGVARLKIGMLEGQRSKSVGNARNGSKEITTAFDDKRERKAIESASLTSTEMPNRDASQPGTAKPTPQILKSLQAELNRVGCSAGIVDGIWGQRSQSALEEFASRQGLKLASVRPSRDLLATLRSADGRVCPLTCGRGFVKKGGHCRRVAVRRDRSNGIDRSRTGATRRLSPFKPGSKADEVFRKFFAPAIIDAQARSK